MITDAGYTLGAQVSPDLDRGILEAVSGGGGGIVRATSFRARQTTTASSQVQLDPGLILIRGQDTGIVGQGTYAGRTVAPELSEAVPASAGVDRYHMIVIRVEDTNARPSWGHDHNGTVDEPGDPLMYVRVITDVSSTATAPPTGYSAEPICRVRVPAGTDTVTNANITDLRRLAQPRTYLERRQMAGSNDPVDYLGDYDAAYEFCPQDPHTNIFVPTWATQAVVTAEWQELFLEPQSPGGANDALGDVKIRLTDGTTTVETTPTPYNRNQFSATNGYRTTVSHSATVNIPAALRGKYVSSYYMGKGSPDADGKLRTDQRTMFVTDLYWRETPVVE